MNVGRLILREILYRKLNFVLGVLSVLVAVGGLVFDTVRSSQGASSLALTLPADGSAVPFFVAGEFQKPSSAFGDAVVQELHWPS